MSVTKLYITGPRSGGEGPYALIAETGEHLATHWCSHRGYALSDLEARRPERQEKFRAQFGEYEVLYLGDDDFTEDQLVAANEAWFAEYEKTLPKCTSGCDDEVADGACPRHGHQEQS